MKKIPETKQTALVRTDFSDDAAWKKVCKEATKEINGCAAYLDFIDDKAFLGLDPKKIKSAIPKDYNHLLIFFADQKTFSEVNKTLLCIELGPESKYRSFRVAMKAMWEVENNLSIANMDFEDFVDPEQKALDIDGVFHGFV